MSLGITQLEKWHAGGISGKEIVLLGDSTTDDGANPQLQARFEAHTPKGSLLGGVTVTNQGLNGQHAQNFANDTVGQLTDAINAAADLYIYCYGINDVRAGGTTQEELEGYITSGIESIRSAVPGACFVLRMPNPFMDNASDGFVTPSGSYATYAQILYDAYDALRSEWSDVYVWDSWAEMFGGSMASHPLLHDSIHPNRDGYYEMVDRLASLLSENYSNTRTHHYADSTENVRAFYDLGDNAADAVVLSRDVLRPYQDFVEADGTDASGDLAPGSTNKSNGSPTASRSISGGVGEIDFVNNGGGFQQFGWQWGTKLLPSTAGLANRVTARYRTTSKSGTPTLYTGLAGAPSVLVQLNATYGDGNWHTSTKDGTSDSGGVTIAVGATSDGVGAVVEIDYLRLQERGALAGGNTTDNLAVGAGNGPGFAGWTLNDCGLALDGTDDRVTLVEPLDIDRDFMLSIWAKRAGTTDTLRLFGLTSGAGDRVEITDNTTITVQINGGTAHTFTVPALGTDWVNVVVRRDVADDLHVYVDGTESSTGAVSDDAQLQLDGVGLSSTSYDDGGSLAGARIINFDHGTRAVAAFARGETPAYVSGASLGSNGAVDVGLWDACNYGSLGIEWVVVNAAGDVLDSGSSETGSADVAEEAGNTVYLLVRGANLGGYDQGDYATRTSGYGSANDGYYEIASATAAASDDLSHFDTQRFEIDRFDLSRFDLARIE